MRLNSLDLIAYGPFTGRRLDFTAPFTIAYGLNEAGKSSALRALVDALYGIPGQTVDAFLHPYNSLRIGFDLSAAGERLRLIRRKGQKQTLRAEDDVAVIEDTMLYRALHGIGRETFVSMFGITHDTLVQGGRELAAGKGEIGKLLFVSAAGLTGIEARLAAIEQQALELYAPRGKKMSIPQAVADLRAAEGELNKKQVLLTKYQENQKALEAVARELLSVETDSEKAGRELERLKRIADALPHISERRQAFADLAALAVAPVLPDDFGDRLRDVENRLRAARDAEREHAEELSRLADTIAARHIPEDLIAAEDEVCTLFDQKGEIRKSKQDCMRTVAKLGERQRSVLSLAGKLRPGATLEDAARMEPGLLARSRVQELAPEAVQLEAKRDAHTSGLHQAHRKLAECEAQISTMPEPPDTSALTAAVARAHRTLDPRRSRDLRLKVAGATETLASALKSLSPWTGVAEEIEALPAPSPEMVEEFREEFHAAAALDRSAREKLTQIEQQLAAGRAERDRMVALEGVPSLVELAAARDLRETGWSAVKSVWKAGDPEAERQFLERTGQSDLVGAYEGAVAGADHIADRLRDNAQRVQQLAALEAKVADLEREREDAVATVDAAVQTAESIRERWIRAWLGCGIVPEPAVAMSAWLRRRDEAVNQARTLRGLRLELEAAEKDEAAVAEELRRLLASNGGSAPGGAAELLAAAEVVLANAEKAKERRQSAVATREAQRSEIARIERELADLGERSKAWASEWACALRAAGLPPDLTPAGAELYLTTVADIAAGLSKIDDYEHRIETMQADADGFASAVAELSARLNRVAAGLDPEAAITQFHQALVEAQQNRKLLQQDQKRQREVEAKRVAAERLAAQCVSELNALCAETGTSSIDGARECWAVSQRRKQLDGHVVEYDVRLRLLSAGKTVDEFLAEAAEVDADTIPHLMEEIRDRVAALRERKIALEEQRRGLDADAHSMQGSDAAAAIRQHMSGIVGRLAADVEHYVRLRTASFVIRKAIDRYRDRNQGPVLERAARVFSGLTCGSFASLRVESDEGDATLVGVRPDGRAVPLEGMSDGTLDQLYLALRIASLEHYFTAHDPAPFIVDDILLNFDDERASAALEALATLSDKTQVILFTHHNRVVELASVRTNARVEEIAA